MRTKENFSMSLKFKMLWKEYEVCKNYIYITKN